MMRSLLQSPRRLTGVALTGAIVAVVIFLLMGAAFSAADSGSGALLFEIVGFGLFLVFIACIVAVAVGVVGILAWLLRG